MDDRDHGTTTSPFTSLPPLDAMDSDSSLTELSSEPSSPGSPLPALAYPSPNSSQGLGAADDSSSSSDPPATKRKLADGSNEPERKKRKRPERKPRTTECLDLTPGRLAAPEQSAQLDLLLKVLKKRRKIVVVAGAGISVSAGIPDFRSSTGLFKSLKSEHKLKASGKQLFDASVYQTDKSTGAFHEMVRNLSGMVSTAKPTAFHHMLSDLGQEGRLLRLYTQNVDGIDVALPSLETAVPLPQKGPWPRSVQLHGGLEKMVCSKCHTLADFKPELFDGPVPPACTVCIEADKIRTNHAGKRSHGIGRLRPRMVLYNEHNPDEDAIGAVMSADLRARPDAIIVVGTSMKIPGVRRIVKEMCGVVRGRRDGLTVWINQDGPPPGKDFEDCWDLIVKGPCDEVARQLTLSMNPHTACTGSDIERAREETKVEVVVNTPQKIKNQGIMTPAASPMTKPLPTVRLIVKKPDNQVTSKAASKKRKSNPKIKTEGDSGIPVKRIRKKKVVAAGVASDGQVLAKSHFKVSKPAVKARKLVKPSTSRGSSPEAGPLLPLPVANYGNHSFDSTSVASKNVLFPNLSMPHPRPAETSRPCIADVSFDSSLTELSSFMSTSDSPNAKSAPHTPNQSVPLSPAAEKLGTVSPSSVPRGMEALFD